MKGVRLSVVTLMIMLSVSCSQRAHQPHPPHPAPTRETVEEYWPDGRLRLRKQVLRQVDGTLVDDGSFERWHDNGLKEYEAFFVQGKKEGTTVRYHKNGQRSTQQEYSDGKRHGLSVTWNEAGAKVKEESWADGQPHGTWTVWKDGEIRWRNTYQHGVPVPGAPVTNRNDARLRGSGS